MYILPWGRFDFGEFVELFHVVEFVHLLYLQFAWCAQYFNDLYQLIDLRIPHKRRRAIDHLH